MDYYITINNPLVETLFLKWKKDGLFLFNKNPKMIFRYFEKYKHSNRTWNSIQDYPHHYDPNYPTHVVITLNNNAWYMCANKDMEEVESNKTVSPLRKITSFDKILEIKGFVQNSRSNIDIGILKFVWLNLNFRWCGLIKFFWDLLNAIIELIVWILRIK